MELLPFQVVASTQIADRYWRYHQDPLMVTRTKPVPFYQNLSAITGSGKTLILADALQQIKTHLSLNPIALWISKGRVVVWQSYTNFSTGKYTDLLGGYRVKPLLDCCAADVEDTSDGLLLVATAAKFNQRDKDQGDRKIFRVSLDSADQSLWNLLKVRRDSKGCRRPLIVIYDEGHNLSDQQTKLLSELDPDALIAASATPKIPEALVPVIERLRRDKGWKDEDLITSVPSFEVVESGLIKKTIMLGGYITPMEIAVNEMFHEMSGAEASAQSLGLRIRPKAIYVSSTNTVDDAAIQDDMVQPFKDRKARPILIWRHLVENLGVDPSEIAVYCELKFDRKFPPPPSFNLFAGGDSDYGNFIAGNYRHIIFNLSLQEGWDDPECCFAYIDKDMGSAGQITQVVGRVLRQPGAEHYPSANLNTAHFYIRTDEKGVFENILSEVSKKLVTPVPGVKLIVRKTKTGGEKPYREPLKERTVPTVSVYSGEAKKHLKKIIDDINDHSQDSINTVGKGSRIQVLQNIGLDDDPQEEWVDVDHSNRVTIRWILRREVQRLFSSRGSKQNNPLNLCDIEQSKFDVLVEYNSRAANQIREAAEKIVDTYIEHSVIVQNTLDNPYKVDKVFVDESELEKFKHSIHEGYSDLNELELGFAKAIDKTKRVWCRNPSQGGFSIPLLDRGDTRNFYPDFLVWLDSHVVAIDTKGDHLIHLDSGRKLFFIEQMEPGIELIIRLVTKGHWSISNTGQLSPVKGASGYTVWSIKQGKLHANCCRHELEAVEACLNV